MALVLCGALWRKLVKNWILEPFVVKLSKYWTIFVIFRVSYIRAQWCSGYHSELSLDRSGFNSPSLPHLFLLIWINILILSITREIPGSKIGYSFQKPTQKLSVQFHYFKAFMCVPISYNEKQESKVQGHLLLITHNFWTVCSVQVLITVIQIEQNATEIVWYIR